MKWKALTLVAAVAGLAGPSIADACEWGLNRSFLGIPDRMNLGIGVLTPTDDLFSSMVISGSLGIGLGDRFALFPAVGMCMEASEIPGGEDFSEVMFGGGAAFRLFSSSDNKFTLNAQAGVSILSYGGATETNIPIQAAGQYQASEKAAFYFGGGIIMGKYKDDINDVSDSDPVLFGGITLMIKKLMLSGGLGAKIGDEDTDLDLGIGLRIPLGGS